MNNPYIRTFTGKKFYPLNPRPQDICIEDIAHSLSQICRFTGHTKFPYWVGQHCCYAFDLASKENKLEALGHDFSETYFSDVASPIKPLLKNYKEIEENLERCIARKFKFRFPYPLEVKDPMTKFDIDTRLLHTEMKQLMNGCSYDENMCYDFKIKYWSPQKTEKELLKRFYSLTNNKN